MLKPWQIGLITMAFYPSYNGESSGVLAISKHSLPDIYPKDLCAVVDRIYYLHCKCHRFFLVLVYLFYY